MLQELGHSSSVETPVDMLVVSSASLCGDVLVVVATSLAHMSSKSKLSLSMQCIACFAAADTVAQVVLLSSSRHFGSRHAWGCANMANTSGTRWHTRMTDNTYGTHN